MKISVIIAAFNVSSTLKRAMDSVFSQSYPDIELLVADGGSTDGTTEILKNCKNRKLI
jgi:glycosyltransferase involved in cell wall biosynthesis